MKPLTKSQQKVYDYLKSEAAGGVPPTVREICAATGLSSTSTVHTHLKTLEKLGYISRTEGRNRAIHITGSEPTAQVPIVGTVTAGLPILAFEDIQGYIPFADKGIPGINFMRVAAMGTSQIHCRYDVIETVTAESMERTTKFIAAFSDRVINSVFFPIEKKMPENMVEKVDKYLRKKK